MDFQFFSIKLKFIFVFSINLMIFKNNYFIHMLNIFIIELLYLKEQSLNLFLYSNQKEKNQYLKIFNPKLAHHFYKIILNKHNNYFHQYLILFHKKSEQI